MTALTLEKSSQSTFLESLSNEPRLLFRKMVRNTEVVYYVLNSRLLQIAETTDSIEPDLLDWIDSIPDSAVLYDLGASNGCFSVYAALTGKQVVSVEAEAQNFAILEMNHYLNRQNMKHQMIALNVALSNETGLGKMYVRDCVAGTHVKILDQPTMVMDGALFSPKHVQAVIKEKLDDVVQRYTLPFPAYIKIDVDGAEEKLLKGAEQILRDRRVKEVFIEIAHTDGE
jgi:FkbM family methyltransferase